MKKILVITASWDEHVPFVTKYLKDDEFIRVDPINILKGDTIDYRVRGGNIQTFYKGEQLNIKSVWFRRPAPLDPSKIPVARAHKDYVRSSLDRHVEMFTEAFPDAFWVSDVSSIRRAEKKLFQMSEAAKLGFMIPDTLFSSDGKQAEAFVRSHGRCIAKSQALLFPKFRMAYARIITKDDKLDYSKLFLDPFTFQEYIEPAYELRVTVMGNTIFAAKVSGKETDGIQSTHRDWRYGFINHSFAARATKLSPNLSEQCHALVRALGLAYGAIDLIVDKMGKTWFLEINPNGQWAFIEGKTGEPMGKTLAAMLQTCHL